MVVRVLINLEFIHGNLDGIAIKNDIQVKKLTLGQMPSWS